MAEPSVSSENMDQDKLDESAQSDGHNFATMAAGGPNDVFELWNDIELQYFSPTKSKQLASMGRDNNDKRQNRCRKDRGRSMKMKREVKNVFAGFPDPPPPPAPGSSYAPNVHKPYYSRERFGSHSTDSDDLLHQQNSFMLQSRPGMGSTANILKLTEPNPGLD